MRRRPLQTYQDPWKGCALDVKVTFWGHACVEIDEAGKVLLFDPFITGNPAAPQAAASVKPDFILLSHAHPDHLGDTVAMAKASGAQVLTTNEIGIMLSGQSVNAVGMHIGGRVPFAFGELKLVLAFHGSGIAGGQACGFILTLGARKVYFAGDTSLYSDMKLVHDLWGPIDIAFLPIGSFYTMDADDAAVAAQWIRPKIVVPIHYNTFPALRTDVDAFKHRVESSTSSKVVVLSPGESADL